MSNNFRRVLMAALFFSAGTSACVQKNKPASVLSGEEAPGHGDYFGPIPGNLEKQLSCPAVENVTQEATINGKRYVYKNSEEINYSNSSWQQRAPADWNAFSNLNLGNMEVVVIDIRRVAGKPYYYYLSNGKQNNTYEPWSSSKFMAAAAAGVRARLDSVDKVGLDASSGNYNLGDMISAMHSYLDVANVPGDSNEMASYFLSRAGRSFATSLFHDAWLKIADDSAFNGGFGADPFPTESDEWTSPTGISVNMRDTRESQGSKNMSALVVAEFLKRLTQHTTDSATAIPRLTNDDMRVLMYGNAKSSGKVGGMLAGDTVYMAEGLMGGQALGRYDGGFGGPENASGKKHFDEITGGRWRIFQKSGLGTSATRGVSEATMASYACLPGFNGGREFVIVTSAHGNSIEAVDKMTTGAFNKIVALMVPGFAPR